MSAPQRTVPSLLNSVPAPLMYLKAPSPICHSAPAALLKLPLSVPPVQRVLPLATTASPEKLPPASSRLPAEL